MTSTPRPPHRPLLSTVILPVERWLDGGAKRWARAEELGFATAYAYDHLSWRSFRDRPWFGAVPTLTAAAATTAGLRLGTLVTSPNFRHPVTLAKDLVALDDISGGRITLGIGAGGDGFDATALGQRRWTPRERADRFEEFLPLLDRLLTDPVTSQRGRYYAADEVRMLPGVIQRPRIPFVVAGTGPRGMRLAARHGAGWVTMGDPRLFEEGTPRQCRDAVRAQLARLDDVCRENGRDPRDLGRVLLTGFTRESPLASAGAFADFAGIYGELGITEIVLHWPVPESLFAHDLDAFESIVSEAM